MIKTFHLPFVSTYKRVFKSYKNVVKNYSYGLWLTRHLLVGDNHLMV